LFLAKGRLTRVGLCGAALETERKPRKTKRRTDKYRMMQKGVGGCGVRRVV
jgi:hypothetical protein